MASVSDTGRERVTCSARNVDKAANREEERALALGGSGRRLHRRAREGERARARLALALRLLRGRRRFRNRGFLGEEHTFVLAGEQPLELVAVDRLTLDEDHRDLVEVVHVVAEDAERELVRL